MTPQEASQKWQQQQARTLWKSYRAGWETGRQNYSSEKATPPATTAAVPPPSSPPSQAMLRALGPALVSLASMGTAIATIVPTAAQIAGAGGSLPAALVVAITDYLASNTYRLAGGASAAWAGEQHGYVQAAAADGLLLDWELDAGADHCADCPALAALPPMTLDQWPTLPGDGATACAAGCKCSMRAVATAPTALTAEQHETISRLGNVQPALIAA